MFDYTFQFFVGPEGTRKPGAGDTLDIRLLVPFGPSDAFVFQTTGSRVDAAVAKASPPQPYVVPNPYVGSASFEPKRFAVSGRGDRRMEFRNIPLGGSVRIYHGERGPRAHPDAGRLGRGLRRLGPAHQGQPRRRAGAVPLPGQRAGRVELDRKVRGDQVTARLGLKGVATLAVAMIAGAAHAQTKTGTTIGAFLTIEPSARIAAMGNAGVTVPQGLDAVYYNPAAISSVEHPGVYFAHSEWLADIAYNYAALGVPMGSFGNAFASVTSLGLGRDRRPHRSTSRSAPASDSPSRTSRSASATGSRSPTASPSAGRSPSSRRRSGTARRAR